MPRIMYVVTHGYSARTLLRGQLSWLKDRGHDVALVSSPGEDLDCVRTREGVETFGVSMRREISILRDASALASLVRVIHRWKPDAVHASTPKAGLLASAAAWIVGVPVRIYLIRGLRLETTRGLKKALLISTERMASLFATRVLAVGQSLADRATALNLSPRNPVAVLGEGSSNGVDVGRFLYHDRETVRRRLGLGRDAFVIGFVGRLTRDKGIVDLVEAVDLLRERQGNVHLLVVGEYEEGDPVPDQIRKRISDSPHVVRTGFVDDTASLYAAMDVLAFPSYREGFPNVPLEASASGIPVVGYRATGTVDAVEDGQTGALVEVGDIRGLGEALAGYANDPSRLRAHGWSGRERAKTHYDSGRIWQELERELTRGLGGVAYARKPVES